MKCKRCGAEIVDDSKFCEYCGTKMTQNKSTKSLWIIIIIVLCAFITGIIIYNQNQTKQATVVKTECRTEDANTKRAEENERTKALAELQTYFADNHIIATPTATGLYYVMIQAGDGDKPGKGTMVKVHYTCKLLSGKVIDSSIERGEPLEVPIGMGYVIPGFDEGIMMMSKGEKGVLYIPYYLGYGDGCADVDIPPFANLIFEVELVDF